MFQYYSEKLSAEKLKLCYELAPPPVQNFLQSEIDYIIQKINPKSSILELGCGYGRVLKQIAPSVSLCIGIDTSIESLHLARQFLIGFTNCCLLQMDAIEVSIKSGKFDFVLCIQNGISAFHVDKKKLIKESLKLTKPGGTVIFSSYSEKFWDHRLEWFELQSKHSLVGEIDYSKTGNGKIVCKDGFSVTTVSKGEFTELAKSFNLPFTITEIADSSIFCEISKI